jgi:hypothetical protein
MTLTRSVSSPVAIGTGPAAVAPCARIEMGAADGSFSRRRMKRSAARATRPRSCNQAAFFAFGVAVTAWRYVASNDSCSLRSF